jgi:choice-of-anchor C domain-containing protein
MQGRIRPATSYLMLALVALASGVLTARAEAQTSIVANGDFESPVVSGAFGNFSWPGFDSWGVEPSAPDGDWASIDIVRDLWPAASGAQSVDLNGSYGSGASLRQTLTTQIGAIYTLSFAFAGNPDPSEVCGTSPVVKAMDVLWGETRLGLYTFDTTGRSLADPGWQTISVQVTATSTTTTLRFDSLVYGACGPALDAVAVTAAAFRPGNGCGDRNHLHARAADCKRLEGSSSTAAAQRALRSPRFD